MASSLMEQNILYKKGIFFRSLFCKGRTFCTTSAVQVCGFGRNSFFQLANEQKWIHSSEKENAATLPRFCTWQPGLSRSPQLTSVPGVKEFDGIAERRKWLKCCNAMSYSESCTRAPNNADFYPARGESRLGSSPNSIPIRNCNLPYEICLWEEISNRIRRGRINMKKAPMDAQNHSSFSAVWAEQCPSELAHTSLAWMEEWELRHRYRHSHQGCKSPTANAVTTPFPLNYLHVEKVLLSQSAAWGVFSL